MDNISLVFVGESDGNREIIDRFSIPKEWLWNEVAVEAFLAGRLGFLEISETVEQAMAAPPGGRDETLPANSLLVFSR